MRRDRAPEGLPSAPQPPPSAARARHDPTPGRLARRWGVWAEVRPLPNGGESRLYLAHARRCIEAIQLRWADEALAVPDEVARGPIRLLAQRRA